VSDDFWRNWAVHQAEQAWRIYCGGNPVPPVEKVEMNTTAAVFEVTFEGGRLFVVEPSGIGRVVHRGGSSA
jgi:hypothetical protein